MMWSGKFQACFIRWARPRSIRKSRTKPLWAVVAEGSVRAQKRDGGALSLRFCDVFEMQAGKIKRLTSYLMEMK